MNWSRMEEGFCLRIERAEHKDNEKSEGVSGKVINVIKESEAEIPESVLDIAHRIGPTYTDSDKGKAMPSAIIRCMTF